MQLIHQLFQLADHKWEVATWTSNHIMGHALHGRACEASEELFKQTKSCVTFVGVLSACSHAGLVGEKMISCYNNVKLNMAHHYYGWLHG